MANTVPLSVWRNDNPVQVVSTLCQRMGAETGIAQRAPLVVPVHEEDIPAVLSAITVRVPEFLDAAQLCGSKDADRGRYVCDGLAVGVGSSLD